MCELWGVPDAIVEDACAIAAAVRAQTRPPTELQRKTRIRRAQLRFVSRAKQVHYFIVCT